MHRRRALGTVGTVAAFAVAGCAGRRSIVGRPDPATFEVSVSGPSAVRLGEAFDVTVTATNVGGQDGTYTGTLRVFDGMIDGIVESVSIGPASPGETGETTVGPVVAAYAGGWAIELDGGEPLPIDVLPAVLDAGESVELPGHLRLTLDSVAVREAYDYRTSAGDAGTRSAPAGFAFVVATVTVENVDETERATPARSEFAGANGEGLFPVYFGPEAWDEIRLEGSPYPGKRAVAPGESVSGWVLLTVSDTGGDAAAVWNRDRVSSPPEALWRPASADP